MQRFTASAMTHLLVVSDAEGSRDWYVRVLDASVYGEYGGTSVVLELLGSWLLLVTGGGPTADKPSVTFAPPADPDRISAELVFGVDDCRACYELLASRGATFLTEPVDHGGEIRAFLREPDGHLFENYLGCHPFRQPPTPDQQGPQPLAAAQTGASRQSMRPFCEIKV